MKKDVKMSEVQLATLASLGYVVWWAVFAFVLGGNSDTVFGFPAWFFYSVILGWALFSIATYVLVKRFFKEGDHEEEQR
jgi:uncharacterized membrane protein YhdT